MGTAPRPPFYELLMICLPLWMKTKFLFCYYWNFRPLSILLITKFFSHVSKLFLAFRSTALQWFQLYVLDRNQSIVVNNSASSPSPLMFGVPQCSVLGPVLFVLYTNPLSDIIASHSVNQQLFADDTQLQKSTPPNDEQSLARDLPLCTDDIKSWVCSSQLKLDEDKTEAILFSTLSLPSDCLP